MSSNFVRYSPEIGALVIGQAAVIGH